MVASCLGGRDKNLEPGTPGKELGRCRRVIVTRRGKSAAPSMQIERARKGDGGHLREMGVFAPDGRAIAPTRRTAQPPRGTRRQRGRQGKVVAFRGLELILPDRCLLPAT